MIDCELRLAKYTQLAYEIIKFGFFNIFINDFFFIEWKCLRRLDGQQIKH